MINPHSLEPTHKKAVDPRFAGGKYYLAAFRRKGFFLARRKFIRASEAEIHATRLHMRWCRLYDAAISGQKSAVSEPTPAPEVES